MIEVFIVKNIQNIILWRYSASIKDDKSDLLVLNKEDSEETNTKNMHFFILNV